MMHALLTLFGWQASSKLISGMIAVLKQHVEEGELFYYEVRGIPFGTFLSIIKSASVTTFAGHLAIESDCLQQALQ